MATAGANMNFIFRMLWYVPSLFIGSIRYVHSRDDSLTELQDTIAWVVGVATTIIVLLLMLSLL